MARDYVSLLRNGENPDAPVSIQLPADEIVLGNVRTVSSDNLITDSAAAATAFACGVKTYNDGTLPESRKPPLSLNRHSVVCEMVVINDTRLDLRVLKS